MNLQRKITLFHGFLIVNQFLHVYEIYVTGYLKGERLFCKNATVFFIFQALIVGFLIFLGYFLLRQRPWIYRVIQIVATIFLVYGLLLAFGNIYKEQKVIGSFTGFLNVMIALPMVLWIADYLKKESPRD